jgi:hypothetical protein
MKKGIILLMLLVPHLQAVLQLPDATAIMVRTRDMTMTGSIKSTISLIITEKGGMTRKRTISMVTKSYTDGSEKRMIKFLQPPDVRGTALLIIDNKNTADEMWIYLPALKRTRRIVSSENGKSFMNSEFSNSDMTSPSLTDFAYKHLPGSGENKEWIIESTLVNNELADDYGYLRKISYFNSDNWQIKKMEFYNYDNQLFKTIIIKSTLSVKDGKYIVKDMTAKNLITGRSSEIIMDNVSTDVSLEDSVFSLQNLER